MKMVLFRFRFYLLLGSAFWQPPSLWAPQLPQLADTIAAVETTKITASNATINRLIFELL
jgi:hypothetical protein